MWGDTMTHRKLYWILTLLIIVSVILILIGISNLNSQLISIGVVSFIILFIVRKVVKIDNNLKNKRDE